MLTRIKDSTYIATKDQSQNDTITIPNISFVEIPDSFKNFTKYHY